jgi:type IV pilus assembly protein PilQ
MRENPAVARISALATLSLLLFVPLLASADPPTISGVSIRGDGDHASVVVRGVFDVPVYSVRARDGGRTIVLDVEEATLPPGGLITEGETGVVVGATASTTSLGVRIELSLSRSLRYHARAGRGRITLTLGGDRGSDSQRANDGGAPGAMIRDVHLERRDGQDRLVVELDRPAAFRVRTGDVDTSVLEIRGARLSPNARRQVRGRADSLVRLVRLAEEDGRAVLEVDRAAHASGTAIRQGSRIVWLFADNGDPAARPTTRTIAREEALTDVSTPEAAAFLTDIPLQVNAARGRQRYGGRRIDLDFKDADIHNILRLLAEVGGVNVVTSDDVSGSVTIRMRNVPWDQALDVILQAKGLGMIRRGNLIRVAPLEALEKEREAAIALQKQRQQLAPIETRLVPVSYATAESLQPRVAELLSERGNVSVDARTNVLIVRDIIENLDDVEELVRTLDTQTPQVLVEARIVEATSSYTRDVGIQWGGSVVTSSATGNPTGLVFPSDVTAAGGAYDAQAPTAGLSPYTQTVNPSNYLVNLPAVAGTGAGGALGLSLGSINGNVNLNVRLSAAEASGTVRIISSPRILTLDNHEASISQGTLIPYSQVSAQGVQTAFQSAKLELTVRPHVTSDGSVSMHVRVTRDEPDFNNTSARGDPTILQREAETDLLVPDGNTAVIGGIYTRNTGRNVDQVPFFGDIPVLGVLFQRRRVRDARNELLIFLTPRIVNRAESLRR